MSKNIKGLLYGLVAAVGLGAAPTFAWLASENGAGLFEFLTARFLLASLLLMAWLGWQKPRPSLTARERFFATGMGFIGYAVSSLCYFSAQRLISVSLAAILLYTYPAVVACLLAVFGLEKMDGTKKAALVISFAGILFAVGPSFAKINILGVVLGLAASVVFALYILAGRFILKETNTAAMTAWVTLAAGIGIGLAGLSSGGLSFQFGLKAWLAILAMAVFSTAIALMCFLKGVVLIGATKASIISTLEQPMTMLLATFFLAETLTLLQFFGGALVLVSAYLASQAKPG